MTTRNAVFITPLTIVLLLGLTSRAACAQEYMINAQSAAVGSISGTFNYSDGVFTNVDVSDGTPPPPGVPPICCYAGTFTFGNSIAPDHYDLVNTGPLSSPVGNSFDVVYTFTTAQPLGGAGSTQITSSEYNGGVTGGGDDIFYCTAKCGTVRELGPVSSVPEIDPGETQAALLLLGGLLVIIRGRCPPRASRADSV